MDSDRYSKPEQLIVPLIDTHCHLDCEPLFPRLDEVLLSAGLAGVGGFIVPGVHPGGWERIAGLAKAHGQIYPAFGIHPMHAGVTDDSILEQLGHLAAGAIAIGEVGLDPSYTVPAAIQEHIFREQLRIAVKLGLPVLVHCRHYFQKTLQLLKEEKVQQVGGIMHAYSGSLEMAREFTRLGFAISICGSVTWSNAARPRELACKLPLEHMVLETDSPDMTPQQHKGLPNQPAWLSDILYAVKCLRTETAEKIASSANYNTQGIFKKMRLPGSFLLQP